MQQQQQRHNEIALQLHLWMLINVDMLRAALIATIAIANVTLMTMMMIMMMILMMGLVAVAAPAVMRCIADDGDEHLTVTVQTLCKLCK